MPRNRPFFAAAAALPLLVLAGCGTPQEQCIARNTGEYRAVSQLLAEVEGNLARGYAWEEREVTSTEWGMCERLGRDKDGKMTILRSGCWRDVTDTERYRVPIDPAAEARKRDNLAAKKAALEGRARAVVEACRKAHPEAS